MLFEQEDNSSHEKGDAPCGGVAHNESYKLDSERRGYCPCLLIAVGFIAQLLVFRPESKHAEGEEPPFEIVFCVVVLYVVVLREVATQVCCLCHEAVLPLVACLIGYQIL